MIFSPHLSDKLIDWRLLEMAGGQDLVVAKHVLELGPCYGLDLLAWAPWVESYTMIDSDPSILEHLHPLVALLKGRGCDVTLVPHNLQQDIPDTLQPIYDLVIDFGTVDNVLAGTKPLAEGYRLLRSGGTLLTTYANRCFSGFFDQEMSPFGDEHRFYPQDLANFFAGLGGSVYTRINEDRTCARAGMAVKKP